MLYSDTGKDGTQSRETSPPEVSPKGRGSKVVLSYIFYWRFNAIRLQFIRNNFCRGAIGPAYRGPNVARTSGSRRNIRPKSRHPERHPASDLQESILLSKTCARLHRYWLSQARFPGFRPIVSGPASYSCFSFSFLPGHAFCLSAFRRVPHFAPFLALYRPCSPLPFPFPFLFPPRYQSPSRSCTCCFATPPVFILPRVLLTRSHPLPVSDRYHLWPDPKASVTATAKPWRRRKVGVM